MPRNIAELLGRNGEQIAQGDDWLVFWLSHTRRASSLFHTLPFGTTITVPRPSSFFLLVNHITAPCGLDLAAPPKVIDIICASDTYPSFHPNGFKEPAPGDDFQHGLFLCHMG